MMTQNKDSDGASQGYEAALQNYGQAIEQMHRGDFASAKQQFDALAANYEDEPELGERARVYARICAEKSAAKAAEPETSDDFYYRALLLANDGRAQEAVSWYDKALAKDPSSIKALYARACAWAMQGNADRAVSDLRSAISVDPTVRFQAANDPDFERIREEPIFIDVIEPTPTGA